MIASAAFYVLAAVTLASALMVVTQRNLFTCALYLAAALSAVGGLFALLGADFLAAVQILLYVGGILVIIAFAVMLSGQNETRVHPQVNGQWIPAALGSGALLVALLACFKKSPFPEQTGVHAPTTAAIGRLLLGDMALPFEAVSLVLLVALAGAVLFSKRDAEAGK